MKSYVKDYSRTAMGNPITYDPVSYINADLDKHPDWKLLQILSSDNYHFYVVYEIKAPRKPRAKKGEPAPVEVPYVEPTLETIEKTLEVPDEVLLESMNKENNSIPKLVDMIGDQNV